MNSSPIVEFEEEMKLREGDKDWLSGEVRKHLDVALAGDLGELVNKNLSGSLRFKLWPVIANLGVIGIVVTTILALGGLVLTEHSAATDRAVKDATFQTETKDKLSTIQDQLKTLSGALGNVQLSSLSSQPVTKESITSIQRIVSVASEQHAQLDKSVVAKAGAKLVEVADTIPDAWKVATNMLDYSSTLNGGILPADANLVTKPTFNTEYIRPPDWNGLLQAFGMAYPPNVPELHPIATGDTNPNTPTGPSYLLMNGGTVRLDGQVMKKVIIRNAVVVYDGGAADLDHVYFVNCQFRMKRQKNEIQLASAIFTDPAVKFSV